MNGPEPSMARDDFGLSLLCRVHEHWCALPLRHVVETMRPLPTSPIPGAPAFVDGVAIIRGGPVPVLNLSCLLGSSAGHPTRFVCVNTDRGRIALAVDHVQGVLLIESGSLRSLPPLLQCADAEAIVAIGTLDAELLLVMQAARLVPEDLWATVNAEAASA